MSAAPKPCVKVPQSAGRASGVLQRVDMKGENDSEAMFSGRCVNVSIRQGQILIYKYSTISYIDIVMASNRHRARALYTVKNQKY